MRLYIVIGQELIQQIAHEGSVNPQLSDYLSRLTDQAEGLPGVVKLIPQGSLVGKWIGRVVLEAYDWKPQVWLWRPELLSSDLDLGVIMECKRLDLPKCLGLVEDKIRSSWDEVRIPLCHTVRPSRTFLNLRVESIHPMLEYMSTRPFNPIQTTWREQPIGDYKDGYAVFCGATQPFLCNDLGVRARAVELYNQSASYLGLDDNALQLITANIRATYMMIRSINPKHLHNPAVYKGRPSPSDLSPDLRAVFDTFNQEIAQQAEEIDIF